MDNYDIVREEMEELEAQLIQFGRDGQSLGIYLFVAATRVQSVRQSLMNNLKTKVVHYLMDATESFTVIGRVPFDLEPFPGRAIVKKEDAYFAQIYLPASGEDDYEILESIKKKVSNLRTQYMEANTTIIHSNVATRAYNYNFLLLLGWKEKGWSCAAWIG